MDRYTAIKYNILFKTCLILFGSLLTLLALSHGWCLLTFQSSTVGCRNKNSFFSRLCADTEAVGRTLGCVHSSLQNHLWAMGKDQDGQPAPFLLERLPPFEQAAASNIYILMPPGPTGHCARSARLSRDNTSRLCEAIPQSPPQQRWSNSASCSLGPETLAGGVNRMLLHLHPWACSSTCRRNALTMLKGLGHAQGAWVDAASAPRHNTTSQHLPQVPLKTHWLLQ